MSRRPRRNRAAEFKARVALAAVRGELVANNTYYPYGEHRSSTGAFGTDRDYTGQRLDTGTGLHFYNARYYDSALGRFISPDSIVPDPVNPADYNRYSYVRNNPQKYVDPSGNITWCYCIGASAGGGGGAISGGFVGLVWDDVGHAGIVWGSFVGAGFQLGASARLIDISTSDTISDLATEGVTVHQACLVIVWGGCLSWGSGLSITVEHGFKGGYSDTFSTVSVYVLPNVSMELIEWLEDLIEDGRQPKGVEETINDVVEGKLTPSQGAERLERERSGIPSRAPQPSVPSRYFDGSAPWL